MDLPLRRAAAPRRQHRRVRACSERYVCTWNPRRRAGHESLRDGRDSARTEFFKKRHSSDA